MGNVGYIKDARGRRVSMIDPVASRLLHRHDSIPAESFEAIAREIGPGMKKRYVYIAVACYGFCLLGLTAVLIRELVTGAGRRFDLLGDPLWTGNLVIGCGGILACWVAARKGRAKRVCVTMLKYRRCPHCGYDLRMLPIDPSDGATVCPECGCAWRLVEEAPTDITTPEEASS